MGEQLVGISFRLMEKGLMSSLKLALKGAFWGSKSTFKGAKILTHKAIGSNKVSISKLEENGDSLQGVEVAKNEILGFDKYAKKYNLSYSLKQDSNDKSRYVLFVRVKDLDKLEHVVKEFINDKKLDNDSLDEKMKNAKEKAYHTNKSQSKQKNKSKGKSKTYQKGL